VSSAQQQRIHNEEGNLYGGVHCSLWGAAFRVHRRGCQANDGEFVLDDKHSAGAPLMTYSGGSPPRDPEPPDDVGKGYGGFVINKPPVKTVDWRSHPRPLRQLGAGGLSVGCGRHCRRLTGVAERIRAGDSG
jgi:hypothetical protein